MIETRTFDVTLTNENIVEFRDAHDVIESDGHLQVISMDGTMAIFAPGYWAAATWRNPSITVAYAPEKEAA